MTFSFSRLASDGQARCGRIHTAHGTAETPAFMAVGTVGAVKAITADGVRATGTEIILGNTYHLMLRPGAERVAALGGLHRMTDWPGIILTDSGGFQVMSLAQLRSIDETGATFRSHIDGSAYHLTPEFSTEIQHALDATITMAFDECIQFPASYEEAATSMRRSMRWAKRSRAAFVPRKGYAQFGIVQGSVYADLRAESAKALTQLGFEGYAIGGLAVGEGQTAMLETVEATVPYLPNNLPRYLMGVGTPDDLLSAIARGMDMFDCVIPTRSGRNGQAFTWGGTLNLRNAVHADDPGPLDENCRCPSYRHFSRAYLHHVVKAGEIIAAMLLTWHNLVFFQELMALLRNRILEGRLAGSVPEFPPKGGMARHAKDDPGRRWG